MLAIAVTLLFALAAFATILVIASSLASGSRRVRMILAELAEFEVAAERATRPSPTRFRPQAALQPMLAAA